VTSEFRNPSRESAIEVIADAESIDSSKESASGITERVVNVVG
jgi:hypothetical protein